MTIARRTAYAAASLAFIAALLVQAAPELNGIGDVNLYRDIGNRVEAVHDGTRDELQSEYPPLATSVFWIASRIPLASGEAWALVVFAFVALSAAYVAAVGKEYDNVALAVGIFLSVQLLSVDLGFGRFDILIALLLALTWVSFRAGRYGMSGFFLTVASLLKVVPVFLIPFLLVSMPKSGLRRASIGIAAGAVFSTLFPLAVLRPSTFADNLAYFLRYHGERGVQHESTLSGLNALYLWLQGVKPNVVFSHGALENASVTPLIPKIATILILSFLACAFAVTWMKVQKRKPVAFDTLILSLLFGMLSLAPVLSPQYFMWVLPLAYLWCVDRVEEAKWRPTAIIAFVGTFVIAWLTYLVYKAGIEKGIISLIVLHNVRSLLLFAAAGFFYALFHRGKPFFAPYRGVWKTERLWASVTAIAVCLATTGYVYAVSKPSISEVRYRHSVDAEYLPASLPVFVPTDGPDVFVELSMDLSYVRPLMYRVKPDDCLKRLVINGREVHRAVIDFCDYGRGRDLDLGKYLRAGRNEFFFQVHDEGGGLGGATISVSPADPLGIGLKAVFACLLALLAVALLRFPAVRSRSAFWVPFFVGASLRVMYVLTSDYTTRGHDTDGHVEYIRYIADHLRLPAAQDGWEFHQAPLYYVLTGVWYKAAAFAGFAETAILTHLQYVSLASSITSLALALWIVGMLLAKKGEKTAALLAGAIVATLPSWLFASVRIGNDVLYQPLALATVALLLRWWTGGSMRTWYVACAFFALAFLAKASALALAPLMFVLFMLRRGMKWKPRMGHAAASALLVALLAGWFPAYRLFVEPDTGKTLSLGNDGMHGGLSVDNSFENFFTFNPIKVLQVPYNNPWDDAHRRKYYWEYLYRSAFFGEFGFDGKLRGASVIALFFGLIATLLAIAGMINEAVHHPKRFLPPGLFAALLFLSSFLYRWNFPYTANQDFRFIVIAVVPLAYFAVRGANAVPNLSNTFRFCLWGLCASSAAFAFLLYVIPA